ncbi:hypothetical protein C8046_00560 [Serinibacter arcticus]|uniref:YdhG-like domain-containing protein n=1 Tax=Serinibacter arcticus TaxID=1655435 RepID=A0A2U1ZR59_9MICO|nr:DUF1801 domain-containing protein [Serinibacter arcticus]PWD49433.1 hypothetical protein C8046_00560 [Serinibacter arcticus]
MATLKHADVEHYLAELDGGTRARVEATRAVVLGVRPALSEAIRWNAPSYRLGDADRLTFNVRGERVLLVLHRGTGQSERRGRRPDLPDPDGLVTWVSDVRGTIELGDLEQITTAAPALSDLLTRWVVHES